MAGKAVSLRRIFLHLKREQVFCFRETIFGYKNLEITLYYTDASMYIYPEIKYDKEISSVSKELKVSMQKSLCRI